jgi:dTDP-glucose 4,6-dehydratase
VEDHCSAIDAVLHKGLSGDVYNIGGVNEWRNLDLIKALLKILGKPESLIAYVKDRPGHDRRYAIDSSKIQTELGWKPLHSFEHGLQKTVEWYLSHEFWWKNILSGEYAKYYERQYGDRASTAKRASM